MKYRMLALILALTVVSWAQTATQNHTLNPANSRDQMRMLRQDGVVGCERRPRRLHG